MEIPHLPPFAVGVVVVVFKYYLFIWLNQVLVAACGIQFLDQGLNPGPLALGAGVLTTGPPGKSQQ